MGRGEDASRYGAEWLSRALTDPNANNSVRRAHLVLNSPARADIWDAIEGAEAELYDAYWQEARPFAVDPTEAERAVDELLERHRPWPAIDLLAGYTMNADQTAAALTP